MPQSFTSPGVDTTEIDQSFIDNPVPGTAAVLVGRTPKGPAFVPTLVSDFDQFRATFGEMDPEMQVPYAARNYLRNANSLLVVRVLGHDDGTSASSGYSVNRIVGISDVSGANGATGSVLATVHASSVVYVSGVAGDSNRFTFQVGSVFATTASFLTGSDDYIEKVLNTDPTLYSTYGHYLYQNFKYQAQAASASWWAVGIVSASLNTFLRDHEFGSTTWVKSQVLGGQEYDLIRFHTRGHGRATNDDVKVTISNIRPSQSPNVSPWGTFDVIVRDFKDTDQRPVIRERFSNVSLNPDDPNYVLRRVGDILEVFDTNERKFVVQAGQFGDTATTRVSRLVRAELNTAVNFPPQALPWGFRGYTKVQYSGSAGDVGTVFGLNVVPSLPLTPHQKDRNGTYTDLICWGVTFVSGGVADRMRALPDLASTDGLLTSSDSDFSLKSLSGTYDNGQLRYWYNSSYTAYAPIYASGTIQKFTLPFAGGFDGWDLRVADPLYLSNGADDTNIGVVAAKRALDTVRNPDTFDIGLLAVPGVHNIRVTDYARQVVNERRDVMFVMDITGSTPSEATAYLAAREIDDNYSACYYPDLKMNDATNHRIVRVPPSVGVMGALAFNDRTGQPFFAPAGLTRGGLSRFDIVDVVDRLDGDDRDLLYGARINPIATFPREGIVVWGQKTLQLRSSALDRVNVRRLLILAKKTIAGEARNLLFEPNNAATWQRFVNRVNPILERYRQDQGVNRFKVVMNSSTNTPDVIDRNEMRGRIFLEPTKAAEVIALDFIVTATGVAFEE